MDLPMRTKLAMAVLAVGLAGAGSLGLGQAEITPPAAEPSALDRLASTVAAPYSAGPIRLWQHPENAEAELLALTHSLDNRGWPVGRAGEARAATDEVVYYSAETRDAARALASALTEMRPGRIVRVAAARPAPGTAPLGLEIRLSGEN